MTICSPVDYYSQAFQDKIVSSRLSTENQWIYNVCNSSTETVILDMKHFVMVKDRFGFKNSRFLIVFKDQTLFTLRDLRTQHIDMLKNTEKVVLSYLKKNLQTKQWVFFFHYMPSVFQLHLHVQDFSKFIPSDRAHRLCHVKRNILQKENWYQNALILTSFNKNTKQFHVHSELLNCTSCELVKSCLITKSSKVLLTCEDITPEGTNLKKCKERDIRQDLFLHKMQSKYLQKHVGVWKNTCRWKILTIKRRDISEDEIFQYVKVKNYRKT